MNSMPSLGMSAYKRFRPPMELDFEHWSLQEARTYFDWFRAQISERIAELKRLVERLAPECSLDGRPDALYCLGEFLLDRVATRPSTPDELVEESQELPPHLRPLVNVEGWQLTENTASVAVDVGIYFAETLRKEHPSITWSLWTRKTVDVNRPVLVGFQGNVPLDPVRVSINIALGEARGEYRPGRLRELFDVWSKKAAELAGE